MKTSLLVATFSSLIFIACKNNTASVQATADSVKIKAMNTVVDERTAKAETLKKLTPYELDKMQSLLPKDIDGVKQTNFNYSMQWGYSYATADYNKTKALGTSIAVYDCAGEDGSLYYLHNFYDNLNKPYENASEYGKTINLSGAQAIETYNKELHYCTLTYMTDERLMVVLQGKKMTPDDLIKLAQKLKF